MEHDPMIQDFNGDAKMYGANPPPMKNGRSMRGNAAAGVAVLATLPWLMFSLIVCLFSFVYNEFAPVVWALVLCCLGLAILLSGLYFVSRRLAHLALGFLCLTGCTVGILVGMLVHESYMGEHSRLERGARYHNVQPAELATSHADAVFLSFSVGSAIDTMHAVGFKKSDETYCAAPILDGTEADNNVQYWAVGLNCCLERGDFECDDAKDPKARGGIVISEDDENIEHYKTAISEVEEAHGLAAPKTALFLRWTTDPNKVIDNLWSSGVDLIAVSLILYLLISVVIAFGLDHFLKLDRTYTPTVRI
jgi:hypothetical protein